MSKERKQSTEAALREILRGDRPSSHPPLGLSLADRPPLE
jgi:hypothetical protein